MPRLIKYEMKMKYEMTREMGVLLRALMTGTVSRTARVSTARCNLKEAVSKLLVRRTGIAYEAVSGWARGQKDSKPNSHSEPLDVYAADIWKESHAPYPGRSAHVSMSRSQPKSY